MSLTCRSLVHRVVARTVAVVVTLLVCTACAVAPEGDAPGDQDGATPSGTPGGPSLDADDGILATLARSAQLAFDMQTAGGTEVPRGVDDLLARIDGLPPGATTVTAAVTRCDGTHPLRALAGAVYEDPGRPGSYVSYTVHDSYAVHGGDRPEPVVVPTLVQIGLNLLILHSSHARNEDDVFSLDGLDRRRLEYLRPHYLLKEVRLVEGGEDLESRAVWQAITTRDDTVRIEWSPSADDRTQRSRLSVYKGVVMPDRDPRWKIDGHFGMPYETIFGDPREASRRSP